MLVTNNYCSSKLCVYMCPYQTSRCGHKEEVLEEAVMMAVGTVAAVVMAVVVVDICPFLPLWCHSTCSDSSKQLQQH
jgi:hypothetical protein